MSYDFSAGGYVLNKLSLLPIILLLAGVGYTQQATPGTSAEPLNTTAVMLMYPNTPAGLESLMSDMLSLKKQKNVVGLAPYLQSLVLPHADAWFKAEFGDTRCAEDHLAGNDCLGPRMAATYATLSPVIPSSFDLTLKDLINESLTSFEAVNYTVACASPSRIIPATKLIGDLTTTPTLSPMLSGMVQHHEPVYAVWSYSPEKETTLMFFVYAENAFRYIGMLHPYDPQAYKDREHVTGNSPANLSPRYLTNDQIEMKTLIDPEVVKRTVVLQIVTDENGKVKNAEYASGPEEYKDLAIKKATKTKYRPPLLFGRRPMQITTCVNVDVRN